MDVNLGLLERTKRKQEKQMTGISDIDQGLETHFNGKNVEDLNINGIDDFRHDMSPQPSSDEDILVPKTPSPVFSRKSRKNEGGNINHRDVKSDGDSVGKHTDRSKSQKDKPVKNKYNDSFHDILNTPSPLITDKKQHNNCMKSAAKMLKSIGDKYGYSSDILPDGEEATRFNSKQEERIVRRDALDRLKIMREKRKSRAEITPEKINSSNKFPKYASGYLGWPSASESSSSSDEDKTIPLRSKRKPYNEARQKRDISQSNSRSIAALAKEQKTKGAKSSGSYNGICGISHGSSDNNGKIRPSDFFESLSMEDSLQNSEKKNYLSMGAKPKSKTSIKTKPSDNQVKSDKNNSYTSKNKIPINSNHDYNIYQQQSSDKSLSWPSPSSILSQHELQTPDIPSNFSMIQTPETPDVTSIDTQVLDEIDVMSRFESPDLVLLGVSPPERSMNHQHNRRQRTGARAAEMRKHRTSRHSANRERTQIDQNEEDCVQLIEQLINDEDYARQLQEEMDKEFALSLFQNQSMNELPVLPQPFPGYQPEGVYGHNFDFVHVNNIHHWHSPPRRRAVHNPRAGTMARNRRVSNVLDDIDVLDGGSGGLNGNYGVNLLNPGYAGSNNALESVEQHLLAMLEDTPPRRGRRRGHYRNPRAFGVGFHSPIGDGNDYEALLQLAEQMGDVRQNGICDGLINRLPIKKYKKCEKNGLDPDECSICMSEYEENDCVRILPCFHRFHAGCVDKWLQNNASCPVCRVEVKLQ